MSNSIIVTLIGRSGMGKSTSIRNLDPKKTAIISTDGKALPFRNAKDFKQVNLKSTEPTKMFEYLKKIKENEEIKYIVIDAFTQWSENLMYYANRVKKGWDRQTLYNDTILLFWNTITDLEGKIIFVVAHPEYSTTQDGEDIVSGRVENKQRKGIIEEKSLLVLFAKNRVDKDKGTNEYFFETVSDGKTTSKAPFEMFIEREIPNDLKIVVDSINEYYK